MKKIGLILFALVLSTGFIAAQDGKKAPKVTFQKAVHDFGKVAESAGSVSCEFTFKIQAQRLSLSKECRLVAVVQRRIIQTNLCCRVKKVRLKLLILLPVVRGHSVKMLPYFQMFRIQSTD